ncbi:hypothetical protein [Undibacterium curvum]|uniref:Uncharacterized protein n=1 Tax=Undibacterium curvum TaxID=2762294 RepID=A0ABR7A0Y0_9BURK|nr:hypothetical protein [Undibacterium curvum]MBC3930504.1 hypothetical protein [Undibacterium curvum]
MKKRFVITNENTFFSALLLISILPGCGGDKATEADFVARAGAQTAGSSQVSSQALPDTSDQVPLAAAPDYHSLIQQAPPGKQAGLLATALGKPNQLLLGLGVQYLSDIASDAVVMPYFGVTKIDIYDRYLNGIDPQTSWVGWNSPTGAYASMVASDAASLGAVPMYTLYQMASQGDGNTTWLTDTTLMTQYWNNVRTLFQKIQATGKPALVNVEPDFWGYIQRIYNASGVITAYQTEPGRVAIAVASANSSECNTQPNTAVGMVSCMISMARNYAPNAYLGFPPSGFPDLLAQEPAFMQKLGAGKADFVVMQTSDRDAGCYLSNAVDCRSAGGTGDISQTYWDTSNFQWAFSQAAQYSSGSYNAAGVYTPPVYSLPLIWWQTPMGTPAAANGTGTASATASPWRDNRMDYFLNNPAQLTAMNTFAVVFGSGAASQTNLSNDFTSTGQHQFVALQAAYKKKPANLPTAVPVYTDNLAIGWQGTWGWNANVNFSSATPLQSGSYAMNVITTGAYGAVGLTSTTPVAFNSPNAAIQLWAYSATALPIVLILCPVENACNAHVTLNLPPAKWTFFSIPASKFGNPGTIKRINIQSNSPSEVVSFTIDQLYVVK